ncbi:putative multidrug resistance-associated, lethal 03659-like isoform x5 protein, partial [Lasius niger]
MMHTEIIKRKEENPYQTIKESFALRLINVNAKWHGDNKGYTLSNVNLTVLPGSFVAVVGQVGSGKSSLLQAILQELPLTNGSIESRGRINYISQQPWIFASSVKQNILFGQTMDKSRYNEVIKVCQMESDIDSFPQGDRTIVGERGINLSGGQRARINLARAIYKDADIYLLDDPLSAVDSHVSRRLVDNCICGYLKGKTRFLVTHQLQYLQLADQIIVMNNGSIEQKGTFNQLQALGLDFMKLLKATDAKCKENEIEQQPDKQRQNSIKNEIKADREASNDSLVEARETAIKGRMSRKLFFVYFKATRSPIFDHLNASLQGLTTIRAFNAENILMANLCSHQDLHSSACFLFLATSRAFGFYIDMICQLYIGVIIVAFTIFKDLAVVGNIGLTITQIMSLTNMLQYGIRQTAELESQMTSIERIHEYSHLEEEPMIDSKPETKLPDNWPTKGHVEFKNVNLKYSHQGDYILRDISFTVLPKEKIGIVGRTGAGKSSLINALFRLACVEGEIRIDDVSTSAIAMHDFRSKISIIPQEPFLFTDSLRRNLDPFDQYSDAMLWQALQDVELKEIISEMAAGLNTKISEGGSNFSVGQRQLFCLARAIIKNNQIMVLDEATANIDPYTDSLIQQTVRTKFINCTVFTIAHRLNTIMDSDRIFVIDAGRLVECDHPYILLQRKGYFYKMVQQTGSVMAENLIDIATK